MINIDRYTLIAHAGQFLNDKGRHVVMGRYGMINLYKQLCNGKLSLFMHNTQTTDLIEFWTNSVGEVTEMVRLMNKELAAYGYQYKNTLN